MVKVYLKIYNCPIVRYRDICWPRQSALITPLATGQRSLASELVTRRFHCGTNLASAGHQIGISLVSRDLKLVTARLALQTGDWTLSGYLRP
jgi:hypothetical protein